MKGRRGISESLKQYSYGLTKNNPLIKIGSSLQSLEKELGKKPKKIKKS